MFKKTKLEFDFDVFLKSDFDQSEGSCIKHQVHELQDIHEQYGGFPSSYNYHNTKINQLWFDDSQIDFKELGRQLGIEVVTVSAIRQMPGCVIPWHRDTFYQISKRFPARIETKVRANVHIQDWKMGHFIQYDNEVFTHWKMGDTLIWDSSVLHLGANAGFEPKFTVQISGFLS